MISEVIDKIFRLWEDLSKREQLLAIATAAVVTLVAVYWGYQRSQETLKTLDNTIGTLENNLERHVRMLAHRDIIESEYAAIAAQHSSEWTEAEIHDRLRQEIYRLAKNTPAPLDANGNPLPTPGNIGNLVEIPSLGKGQMAEGGEGYREYHINLRIPPTELRRLIQFLERLHNSPQSLRIDALDLNRPPEQELVSASINISRIIADGATLTATDALPESPAGLGRIHLSADNWKTQNASVQNMSSQSIHGAVTLQMMASSAEVYMTHTLAGGNYEMTANLASSSPDVMVGVADGETGRPLSPMQAITGNGQTNQYQIRFTIPDNAAPTLVQCPLIRSSSNTGAMVQLTGLLLQSASEIYQ